MLKVTFHRCSRNVGEKACFLVGQGLACLWGFPCDALETLPRMSEILFLFT